MTKKQDEKGLISASLKELLVKMLHPYPCERPSICTILSDSEWLARTELPQEEVVAEMKNRQELAIKKGFRPIIEL